MKITNKQVEALAVHISTEINNRCKNRREVLIKELKYLPTKSELKAYGNIKQNLKKLPGLILTSSYSSIDIEWNAYLKDKTDKLVEDVMKKEGYLKVSCNDILNKLYVASIGANDLEELKINLAKELGINL